MAAENAWTCYTCVRFPWAGTNSCHSCRAESRVSPPGSVPGAPSFWDPSPPSPLPKVVGDSFPWEVGSPIALGSLSPGLGAGRGGTRLLSHVPGEKKRVFFCELRCSRAVAGAPVVPMLSQASRLWGTGSAVGPVVGGCPGGRCVGTPGCGR